MAHDFHGHVLLHDRKGLELVCMVRVGLSRMELERGSRWARLQTTVLHRWMAVLTVGCQWAQQIQWLRFAMRSTMLLGVEIGVR